MGKDTKTILENNTLLKLVIVRNNREGYGYKDNDLKCNICGSLTTRYIFVELVDRGSDRELCTMFCRNCLSSLDEILAKDLLENIKNECETYY